MRRPALTVLALTAALTLGLTACSNDPEVDPPASVATEVAPPPAAAGAALDGGAQAACDSLAYDLSDFGGLPEALAEADAQRWAVMVRQYRHALGDSGNVLIRDSGEVLENAVSANASARMLALDTSAGRCFDAGWNPD